MAKKARSLSGAIQGAVSGVAGRFLDVPKGKKVVLKFWYSHDLGIDHRPIKFYDKKIVGYLANDFSLSVGSKLDTPFEKASSAILNTLVTAVSGGEFSLINKYTAFPVFNGGKPLTINLELEFKQTYDAFSEVFDPLNYLSLSSLPYERGNNGLLVSSYPNFGHIAENVTNILNQLKGKIKNDTLKKGLTSATNLIRGLSSKIKQPFTYVELTIGDTLLFAPIIITEATPTYSNELATSRLETITKLTNLITQYISVPEARSVITSKLAEYSLNIPILNVQEGDFSPTRRYPSSGKISLNIQTLWAYTQNDAKKSMNRPTIKDDEKKIRKTQSVADKLEESLDKIIFNSKRAGVDDSVKELVRSTLGDLVAGGSI